MACRITPLDCRGHPAIGTRTHRTALPVQCRPFFQPDPLLDEWASGLVQSRRRTESAGVPHHTEVVPAIPEVSSRASRHAGGSEWLAFARSARRELVRNTGNNALGKRRRVIGEAAD